MNKFIKKNDIGKKRPGARAFGAKCVSCAKVFSLVIS